MKTNTKREAVHTHEGAVAQHINPEQQLRRSVMACMLWEDEFYESGESIAKRIKETVALVTADKAAAIAIEARSAMKLRHAPLLIAREMARLSGHKGHVAELLPQIIQRADELSEFLSIYWREGRCKVSAQVKKGLAAAFPKFNEYSLAKYNRDGAVKLRDVLFLCHAKPKDDEQAELWKRLINGTLATPDTWEVALSGGANKKEAFMRLMAEKKLLALAFLRNLRNMHEAGIAKKVVADYGATLDLSRVLPFRFIAAARAVPQWEDVIEPMLLKSCSTQEKLPGKTVLVVDVSGSMYTKGNVSARSDMTRVDVAAALAAICREICEEPAIYATAGDDSRRIHATAAVPSRRGFALADLFGNRGFASTLGGGGIFLVQCLNWIKEREKTADRVIVLTDEQDCDNKFNPSQADAFGKRNYLVNIASARNGIAYDKFVHIDGWSEAIIDYIRSSETEATVN